MTDRYLIVGLGNPDREYKDTRHNIGFRCVDALAEVHGLVFDQRRAKARAAAGTITGRDVLLAKPQTYMNLSGDSVGKLVGFYKIPPERVMVILDDLDIPLGTLRIRKSGGTGGHKGMKSIIERLGTQDFPRIRFGIGRPPGRMDPAAFVLRPFQGDEIILAAETIDRVVRAISTWLTEGIENAMNQYNGTAESAIQRESPPESLSTQRENETTS